MKSKPETIKRNCVVCKKPFIARRYHGLDAQSMSEALVCPKHRVEWMKPKQP